MAYEVINKVKGRSTIRCVDAGTYTITLNDLRANSNIETVLSASMTDVSWSTSGYISIVRNSVPQLNLFNSGSMTNVDGILPNAGANNNTQSLVITINAGGSVIVNMSKLGSYNVDAYRVLING
mgnify:CR=1 FL=1